MKKYNRRYYGLTHPRILGCSFIRYLWKKFFCKRNFHLFDECESSESWCLHCDACELMVEIDHIDDSYVQIMD